MATTNQSVKFYKSHAFYNSVSDFPNVHFGGALFSPWFITAHENIGIKWQLKIEPRGGKCAGIQYPDHVGFYLRLDMKSSEFWKSLPTKVTRFVEVGLGRKTSSLDMHNSSPYTFLETKISSFGTGQFLPVDIPLGFLSEEGMVLNVGVEIEIPVEVFHWKGILERQISSSVLNQQPGMDLTGFFEDILVRDDPSQLRRAGRKRKIEESSLSRPAEDESRVLDFQIFTSDGKIIWCHKNILAKKNAKFRRMCASIGLKEAESNQVKINREVEIMKEVLHFIYTNKFSENFPALDTQSMVDAAEEYELMGAKFACEKRMIQEIDVQNAADFLQLADRYQLSVLKEFAMNFIVDHCADVWSAVNGRVTQGTLQQLWTNVMDVTQKRGYCTKMPISS